MEVKGVRKVHGGRWPDRSWVVCAPSVWKVIVQVVRLSSLIISLAISSASLALCQQLLVSGLETLGLYILSV
jgi:hypothetical protein